MSKFVNVTVSTSLSTDFYLEVPDNATKEQIKALAEKEVMLPTEYPKLVDSYILSRYNIKVQGINAPRTWNVDELEIIVE